MKSLMFGFSQSHLQVLSFRGYFSVTFFCKSFFFPADGLLIFSPPFRPLFLAFPSQKVYLCKYPSFESSSKN